MLRKQSTSLVLRSPMKLPTFTNYFKITYPDTKLYNTLNNEAKIPQFANMSPYVKKVLWKHASLEEYRPRSLIDNGRAKSEFDFLYVIDGSLQIKLDKVKTSGSEHSI
jgi:hypothetical protein